MKAAQISPEELTLDNILQKLASDEAAREFLETWLWQDGPVCPRCQSTDKAHVYRMTGASTRAGLHNCKDCRRQFTVTVGTIFEDSHIPLRKWLVAWFLLCSSKKGMSSLQLKRILDLGSYRTALFMTHRIRHALANPTFSEPLKGDVEFDSTYVGGKEKRGFDRRSGKRTTGFSKKTAVVSLQERGGEKRSVVMERVNAQNLAAILKEHVAAGSRVHTDESQLTRKMDPAYEHHASNHSKKQFVLALPDGNKTHTNTLESSFGLLKRGVYGTFHSVSKKHLHRYVAEFDYRWNARKTTDGERTVEGLKKARGKRVTYAQIKHQ